MYTSCQEKNTARTCSTPPPFLDAGRFLKRVRVMTLKHMMFPWVFLCFILCLFLDFSKPFRMSSSFHVIYFSAKSLVFTVQLQYYVVLPSF